MTGAPEDNNGTDGRRRTVLELTYEEARKFFLKAESYCDFDLPTYIVFDHLLERVATFLNGNSLTGFCSSSPRDNEELNHVIFNNKDGKYAWRPMTLIHPAIYVSLVHAITEEDHWMTICDCFSSFFSNPKISCLSIPGESLTEESDKAEQISSWWQTVEQKSIELALEYEYLVQTDITDCYGSVYTHSIVWSLHTKPEGKKKENRTNKNLIGVLIDHHLQDMSHGQTNGIPQGSVLMDFIAEMVLGYADQELTKGLVETGIEDYQILRYRDDYRIFVNNPQDGEKILKALTGVLIDLGFKLNSSKTTVSNQVVRSSIKSAKLAWMTRVKSAASIQNHLLIIHDHSVQFPNSGSLVTALTRFYKRLNKRKKPIRSLMPLISIIVDIAYHNPRTYPTASAILSKLLSMFDSDEMKGAALSKVKKRFEHLPNTGHMQIWLQRIALPVGQSLPYHEPICRLVDGEDEVIWNVDWISSHELKRCLDPSIIIDRQEIENMQPVVPIEEVELFASQDRYW